MSAHRETCPEEPVECLFAEAGCTAKLVRRELDTHLANNQQMHILVLMHAFSESRAELRETKCKLEEEGGDLAEVKEELQATNIELDTFKKAIVTQVDCINTELNTLKEVVAVDVKILRESEQSQANTAMYPMYSTVGQKSAQKGEKLTVQISNLKFQASIALQSIQTQLELKTARLTLGGEPLTIRMPNFSQYKRSGKVWHSPPFYYREGYKMRLGVYANGVGAGAGTHVSVSLLLLRGEFDDHVAWPVGGYGYGGPVGGYGDYSSYGGYGARGYDYGGPVGGYGDYSSYGGYGARGCGYGGPVGGYGDYSYGGYGYGSYGPYSEKTQQSVGSQGEEFVIQLLAQKKEAERQREPSSTKIYLCPRCSLGITGRCQRVPDGEGSRVVGSKVRFADHQTVQQYKVLHDSIVLRVTAANHHC